MAQKNEYIERTLKFHEIYQNEIVPIFRSYEVYRRRAVFKVISQYVISAIFLLSSFWVPASILSIAILGKLSNGGFMLALVVTILLTVLSFFIINSANKTVKGFGLTLKQDCLEKVLSVFGNITWENGKNITTNTDLLGSGLFAAFNRRTTDDEFEGEYNGVSFKICETELWHESGSGKTRTVVPCIQRGCYCF